MKISLFYLLITSINVILKKLINFVFMMIASHKEKLRSATTTKLTLSQKLKLHELNHVVSLLSSSIRNFLIIH